MKKAYLLTGANMGDRLLNLSEASKAIEKRAGKIIAESSIYETAAWGNVNQPGFLNQALCIETEMDPNELLVELLSIEKQMGRERFEKMGPRIIDIDILFYDNAIINSDQLSIPHPQISRRRFVLSPLNEIAPELVHPVSQKTIGQLLEDCEDDLAVKKITGIEA